MKLSANGWPRAARRARTRRCTTPSTLWPWSCACAGDLDPGRQGLAEHAHRWTDAAGEPKQVTSPVSLVVSAFASWSRSPAPGRRSCSRGSALLLVDPGAGANRLAGSMLAQVSGQFGDVTPDVEDPSRLVRLASALSELRAEGLVSAYHDRSDGGLWATVCELAFAGSTGSRSTSTTWPPCSPRSWESCWASRRPDVDASSPCSPATTSASSAARSGPPPSTAASACASVPTSPRRGAARLAQAWDEVSWRIASLRDNPECADEEHAAFGADVPDWWSPPPSSRTSTSRPPTSTSQSGPRCRAARAGREQPRRDRLRLRPRRVRGLGRPHDRSADRPLRPGAMWWVSWRAAGSPTATRSGRRGLGPLDPVQPAPDGRILGVLRPNRHVRPRHLQRLQMFAALADLIPGADAWPRFTRNRSSSSRGGSARSRCWSHRRCSSRAWPAAGSRSRWRTARAWPTSPSRGRGCVVRAARFVDQPVHRRRPIPRTRTAHRRSHRRDNAGRSVHRDDAPPGGASHGTRNCRGRRPARVGQPLAADVSQRAGVGRLSAAHTPLPKGSRLGSDAGNPGKHPDPARSRYRVLRAFASLRT